MAMVETYAPRIPSAAPVRSFGAMPAYDTPAMAELREWVDGIAARTQPDRIHWIDGSRAENNMILGQLVDEGKLIKLNPEWRPGSYWLARTPATSRAPRLAPSSRPSARRTPV